jgi:hypothetical protein
LLCFALFFFVVVLWLCWLQRAIASVQPLNELNPSVIIEARVIATTDIDEAAIRECVLVIASELSDEEETRMDELCRITKIPFMSNRSFGFQAVLFMDLQSFTFQE